MTVFPRTRNTPSHEDKRYLHFHDLLKNDDVYQDEFLASFIPIFEDGTCPRRERKRKLEEVVKGKPSRDEFFSYSMPCLAPGPYLIVEGSIWPVCRLHDDVQGAFIVAVEPQRTKRLVNDTFDFSRGPRY